MSDALTPRQRQILDVIVEHQNQHGYPPSVREIGGEVGLKSPATVKAHLDNLKDAGYLIRDPAKPRAIQVRYEGQAGAAAERRPVRHVPLVGDVAAGTGVLADVLGLDGSEIRDALKGGSTIADLAAEQGVSVDDVVDALVAQAEQRVAAALESGRIDQEKADEILANVEQHAEDIVNGEAEPGKGHGRRGGPADIAPDA